MPSLLLFWRDRHQPIAYAPAIGVVCVLLFQAILSQFPWMNSLFEAQPLSWRQAIVCLAVGAPVVLPTLLLRRFAPLT
ncbi:MAG: cation transporting ATPase C-terminal domain-containing protein [Elainella sp. Prado103]|nr:cation transporting ATPase C-terminal domain-containing protein [Elainella sp. Prado103]